MKWTRILATFIGVVLLVAATGYGGHAAKKTALRVVADNGLGNKAVFHLRCDPPGGNFAHPAHACAALEENPDALLSPEPSSCSAGTWTIAIGGRFEGRTVNVKTTMCWTSQMELINLLGISTQLDALSYGLEPSLLAKTVRIPAKTPVWLIVLAHSQAVSLQDPRPDKIRFRLGRVDVIEFRGHFNCECCEWWSSPWGGVMTGTSASITVDPKTHGVDSFRSNCSLKRK